MKIQALVVSDVVEDRVKKTGEKYLSRTLAVVDQDPDETSRLAQMVNVNMENMDEHKGGLVGQHVVVSIKRLGENFLGVNCRGPVGLLKPSAK